MRVRRHDLLWLAYSWPAPCFARFHKEHTYGIENPSFYDR